MFYAELREVLQNEEFVEAKHRANLPYTNATILEIQRCGVIVPMTQARYCSKDILVNGILFKKGKK